MPATDIDMPMPHAAQQRIIDERARFNVVCCGCRFGKTTLAVNRLMEVAAHGFPVAWFAPTYKLLMEPWRDIGTILAPANPRIDKTEHRIEFASGYWTDGGKGHFRLKDGAKPKSNWKPIISSIDFWSLEDPDDNIARGRKYALVVIDEAAGVRGLKSVWERLISTRLTDLMGGAWIISTPRGCGDFKDLYDLGQDPLQLDWKSWRMPTSSNPIMPPIEIERARERMTEASFNQEYLAEFVNWEGAVFRRVRDAVRDDCLQANPISGHEYVIGADWGRSIDYTVFTVIDVTLSSVAAIDRSNQVDYSLQRGRLEALRNKWKPSAIVAEMNSIGQPIIEQLGNDGIDITPFTTSNQSKSKVIESLALAFEQQTIRIPNDNVLISELESFTGEVLPSGLIRYGAPQGKHDDCAMSLSLAWFAAFAGHRTMGLVDYVKEKQLETPQNNAQKVENMAKKLGITSATSLLKPKTGENTTNCPFCGSLAISTVAGHKRCNQCGQPLTQSTNTVLTLQQGHSRSDLLRKAG